MDTDFSLLTQLDPLSQDLDSLWVDEFDEFDGDDDFFMVYDKIFDDEITPSRRTKYKYN
jgi:hypothetical protein